MMLLQENNQPPEGDHRSGFLKTLGVKEGQRLGAWKYILRSRILCEKSASLLRKNWKNRQFLTLSSMLQYIIVRVGFSRQKKLTYISHS